MVPIFIISTAKAMLHCNKKELNILAPFKDQNEVILAKNQGHCQTTLLI